MSHSTKRRFDEMVFDQMSWIRNFLSFCQIFLIFFYQGGEFYVVLEKGHGAGKKGMALKKKGMA